MPRMLFRDQLLLLEAVLRIRTFLPDPEISPPDPDPALVVFIQISVSVQYRAYVYLFTP
jgi:hypothetical protein